MAQPVGSGWMVGGRRRAPPRPDRGGRRHQRGGSGRGRRGLAVADRRSGRRPRRAAGRGGAGDSSRRCSTAGGWPAGRRSRRCGRRIPSNGCPGRRPRSSQGPWPRPGSPSTGPTDSTSPSPSASTSPTPIACTTSPGSATPRCRTGSPSPVSSRHEVFCELVSPSGATWHFGPPEAELHDHRCLPVRSAASAPIASRRRSPGSSPQARTARQPSGSCATTPRDK